MANDWITNPGDASKVSPPEQKPDFFKIQVQDEMKKGIDVLLYSGSNGGKTFTSMTFPAPIYFIDTERRANKTRQFMFPTKQVFIYSPLENSEEFKSGNMNYGTDFEKTVDNTMAALKQLLEKAKKGEIKEGTVVIDSFTDIWTWMYNWAKIRLIRIGKVDPNSESFNSQFSWGLPTAHHNDFVHTCRQLLDYGINVVGTARETSTPDYVQSKSNVKVLGDEIRGQKDLCYWFSNIVRLQKRSYKTPDGKEKNKYIAKFEKLESFDTPHDEIENINYEKIKEMIDSKRKEALGGGNK